jgi:hypothetical protein
MMAFIVARWSCLLAKTTQVIFLKEICSSCHDDMYRGTMALLGAQADETHKISYNFELNPPIAVRLVHRATVLLVAQVRKNYK